MADPKVKVKVRPRRKGGKSDGKAKKNTSKLEVNIKIASQSSSIEFAM